MYWTTSRVLSALTEGSGRDTCFDFKHAVAVAVAVANERLRIKEHIPTSNRNSDSKDLSNNNNINRKAEKTTKDAPS